MVSKSFLLAVAGATVAQACTFPYVCFIPFSLQEMAKHAQFLETNHENSQAGQLTGNSVTKPSLTDFPTIGVPYSVTYDGTGLGNSLTFILLRGPGDNIAEIGSIGTGVTNCGTASCTWSWTPASTLEPDTTHYGIKLLDEASCKYQYTTQFGINAGTSPKPSSVAPPAASSAVPAPSKFSSVVAPPPASSGVAPTPSGKPEEDCDDEPTASSYPSATGGKATNGTSYTTGASTPTYTPVQSNDARRFAISAFGAIVAFTAAIMVL
jgi:hypothetical protein